MALQPGALDSQLQTAWDFYKKNALTITDPAGELVGHQVVGSVDATSEDFIFHLDTIAGTKVATIPSPFNTNFQSASTWGTATQTVLEQYGPFLLPTSITANGTTYPFPENAAYPNAAATIGNKVSTAMNRGVFGSSDYTTISCSAQPAFFPTSGVGFFNYYAYAVATTFSSTAYGYGQSYSIPYNDQCGYSTTISSPIPAGLNVVVHPF